MARGILCNIETGRIAEAVRRDCCWLCGERLGRFYAFAIGPMCSINRVSSEPPSHRACAGYAVLACPFLSKPAMRRNLAAAHDPTGMSVPGIMVQHNPGATLIWVTKSYRIRGGLFYLGEPIEAAWFAEGRTATRAEIDAAIAKGLPLLRSAAALQGPDAIEQMERQLRRVQPLLPTQ